MNNYVAGDHMDSEDLTIHRKGCFTTDDVGPAFIRVFKPGQIFLHHPYQPYNQIFRSARCLVQDLYS